MRERRRPDVISSFVDAMMDGSTDRLAELSCVQASGGIQPFIDELTAEALRRFHACGTESDTATPEGVMAMIYGVSSMVVSRRFAFEMIAQARDEFRRAIQYGGLHPAIDPKRWARFERRAVQRSSARFAQPSAAATCLVRERLVEALNIDRLDPEGEAA
ncbi:MAG: hypothetical protein AAGJ54_07425 [Planctomycetota bacterium]